MLFAKLTERMDYIEELIRKEATGTPEQLAARLKISKRMVYRYINEINEGGKPVVYCRTRGSYKFL